MQRLEINSRFMDVQNPKRRNTGRNYVRAWRKHRGLTQEELAAAAGYSASSISQLETGHQGYEEETLIRLAAALKCHPADLISGPPAEQQLIHDIRMLPEDQRDAIVSALNAMLGSIKKITKLDH